jgi:hypothetical protein
MPDPLFVKFLTSLGINGLRQKGCHILVKSWIFDDPFHKKLPVLVTHFGASDDQTIGIREFFWEIGL